MQARQIMQIEEIIKKEPIKATILVVLYGLYLLMFIWLVSCQKPEEQIVIPDGEASFTKNSELGAYIFGISLLDGSKDNIIDNTSNLLVELPVKVQVNGEEVLVNSFSDLIPIRESYDLNPYVRDFMSIQYPIQVTKPDYSKVIINNDSELKATNFTANSSLNINAVSCLDFNYPIRLSSYDPLNQQADTKLIDDDKMLFYTLNNVRDDVLISFVFPVTVSIHGTQKLINDNQELQLTIQDELAECNENHFQFYPDEPITFGGIKLLLTDAPFPIDEIAEANVIIDRIDVKTGPENDSIPKITLFNDSLNFNLIELTNGITSDLSELEIPIGTYDFFRVYVRNGNVLLKDGRSFDLTIPSGNESGILIKPNSPITVSEEGINEFLFDFDLSRSFIPKGNPNNSSQIVGFNFKPVIRVSNTDQSGTLKGKVVDLANVPVSGVQITIFAADTINTAIFSEAGGNYTVLGLSPGNYVMEAEKEGYSATVAEEFIIIQNEVTTKDFSIEQL